MKVCAFSGLGPPFGMHMLSTHSWLPSAGTT
jgi:hypothetical protein